MGLLSMAFFSVPWLHCFFFKNDPPDFIFALYYKEENIPTLNIFLLIFSAVPSKPQGPLEITDFSRTSVSIRWKAPPTDGGSPITDYIIERKTTKGLLWTKVDSVDSSVFDYTITSLYENTDYLFRVLAVNSVGTSEPLVCDSAVTAKSPYSKCYSMYLSIIQLKWTFQLVLNYVTWITI